jgi:hypothetical protein
MHISVHYGLDKCLPKAQGVPVAYRKVVGSEVVLLSLGCIPEGNSGFSSLSLCFLAHDVSSFAPPHIPTMIDQAHQRAKDWKLQNNEKKQAFSLYKLIASGISL